MALEADDVAEAERCAREAVDLLEPVPAMRCLALSSLARVHLAKSQPALALECSRRATEGLDDDDRTFYGEALVRLVHYEALVSAGEPSAAREVLELAQKRLHERAARITDPELRRCFVERVPEHQKTLALSGS
jgi:ATP/maltotriose-dependent transcriptional regulator MalT